jgi:uroporphyrin-III C-methyltransferase/precorrin-2 dehydrogenase/sirohydrochlorin ferrochelatase
MNARRLFWDRALDGDIAELVLQGREREAASALRRSLAKGAAVDATHVALIGAGVGDAERLPLGALRWLGRADRIVYEPKVPATILGLARRDARREPLGRGSAGLERFVAMATEHAEAGTPVCLLRAGDPYAASKQPAEVRALRVAGVRFALFRPAP